MVQKISPALKFFLELKLCGKRLKNGEDFPQKWMNFFNLPILCHNRLIMEDKIAGHIGERLGIPRLVELLAGGLTGSELNSLLLAVYEKKVEGIRPTLLLQQYRTNRFVHPADLDMIEMLEHSGFEILTIGPDFEYRDRRFFRHTVAARWPLVARVALPLLKFMPDPLLVSSGSIRIVAKRRAGAPVEFRAIRSVEPTHAR